MHLGLPAYASPWVGRLSSGPRLHPLPPCHRAHVSPRRLSLRWVGRLSSAVRSPRGLRTSYEFLFSIWSTFVAVSASSGQRRVGDNPPYPRHRGRCAIAPSTYQPINLPALPKNKAPRTKNKDPLPPSPSLRLGLNLPAAAHGSQG